MLTNLDNVVRKYTAFGSFLELIHTPRYRPTLYTTASLLATERKALTFLADFYDYHQRLLGDPRRAYRV